MRTRWLVTILFVIPIAYCQSADVAKQVYSSAQDSVFLVYLNDSSGSPSAIGSAFLIAPRTLITNAHVANAGSPVLAVGPVRIPLKILRTDEINDLALLSVEVDLTSKPLPMMSGDVSPGEQVFAIGNPEGLEKTISQGIVSGLRQRGGRDLLQITSPISHGSSGGPILNSKSQVVGVAVGMLEDGQNLNFAVPVAYVRALLEEKVSTPTAFNLEAGLSEVRDLTKKFEQATYSNDPNSEYMQESNQIANLMDKIVSSTTKEEVLNEMACLGTKTTTFSDAGIRAARKLIEAKPTAMNRALLSYVLYDRAEDESIRAQFADDGSEQKTSANMANQKFITEADREATETARTAKGNALSIASFVLGGTKSANGKTSDAINFYTAVTTGSLEVCGNDLTSRALQDLISESETANRPDDAERWFRRYASNYEPLPYQWDAEGDRRSSVHDPATAADAYEKAANGDDYYGYDFCFAAVNRYLEPITDSDRVLDDGRKCVDASVKQADKQRGNYFKSELPAVYRFMANVLETRGSYQSALEYIKESLAEKPDDPFALNTEALIFSDLERNSECISAAQAAIRASDGKYPFMQFRLGYCLFATGNWSQAATSFRIAAEADSSDAVSAFNLGLCLSRQGFSGDANRWFHEALNRKPDNELREKILNALK